MINDKEDKDYEINLIEVLKILWKSKWIIIFATLIMSLIGLIFSYNQTPSYNVSTPISYGKTSIFVNFIQINDILKENDLYLSSENPNGYRIDALSIFEMLLNEFNDNAEIIVALNKNEYFEKLTKDLNNQDKYEVSLGFAKSFKISTRENISTLSFSWHDVEEGKKIIDEALQLSLINVKTSIIEDLNKIANFIDMKNQRQVEGLRKALNLLETELPFLGSNLNNEDIEMSENIETLKETILMSFDYNALKETITSFGKNFISTQLRTSLDTIKYSDHLRWIDYNLSLAESEPQNSNLMNISVFTILGLVISCIYVLFLSIIRTINKKK